LVEVGTPGDAIRGVLVERRSVCKVVIGFDTLRRAVSLRIPLEDLRRVEAGLRDQTDAVAAIEEVGSPARSCSEQRSD
jgi:hypothetical protein